MQSQYKKDLAVATDKIEVELQKLWLQMACFALHGMGLSEAKLTEFIGSWKSLYRWNARLDEERQKAEFALRIAECFPHGYPDELVRLLER